LPNPELGSVILLYISTQHASSKMGGRKILKDSCTFQCRRNVDQYPAQQHNKEKTQKPFINPTSFPPFFLINFVAALKHYSILE
jgi:hypothetical protein